MLVRNEAGYFSPVPILASIALLSVAAVSHQAHAFPLETALDSGQLTGNGQSANWNGPTSNISSEVGTQASSIDIEIIFAGNQYLRMIDFSSFQVDRIGISLGGFSTSTPLTEFWVSYQVEFTDADGNPISTPPLTNNPVSSSFHLTVPGTGVVFGGNTSGLVDFLSADEFADIYGLHYAIDFFGDSGLTNPVTVDFLTGSASFAPRLSAADPILIREAPQTSVPEPATTLLFAAGLMGIAGFRRRLRAAPVG
ncbi:MAG: PEP-CTERM sorting domain-containing protein [Chromatiales bacterium]|jgi:hypothetical protein